MESSAARLLHLLSLFTSRPAWNATELAERLDVTTRTVRRDVAQLRELGYPIESDAGRTGGYRLGAGGRLPPLLLTDDEAVAVAIGLRLATGHGVADHDDAAMSALVKLEQVLPPVLRDRVGALNDATDLVARQSAAPVVDPEALLTLAAACRRHERLTFVHHADAGAITDRRVEPYRLVSVQRRWYLVVWDLERRDWRTFRVDRIHDVVATGHTFEPVATPDAASMVVEGIARYPYDVQAEIVLDVPIDVARHDVPPTVGVLEALDDHHTRMFIGADDCEWIARFLAGLECGFEVVSPPELVGALRQLGERLATTAEPRDRQMGGS
jgi:predicted DNA-binding transcriptional regulator YafY